VGLALEVHPAGLLELLSQGVEVFDGEGDVAVALAEGIGLLAAVVEVSSSRGSGSPGTAKKALVASSPMGTLRASSRPSLLV
jgi:hypothetical protein